MSPQLNKIEIWKEKLSNLTELVLPTDYPRPIPLKVVEAERILEISEETALSILQLNLQSRSTCPVTPFSILLSCFSVLLHKYTGEEDISIGSSSSSFNPLVLRLTVSKSQTIQQLIQSTAQIEQAALTHEIPYEELFNSIVKDNTNLNAHHSDQQTSLFKVRFFNMVDTDMAILANTSPSAAGCDMTIFISQAPTLRRLLPIQIRVMYNAVLFSDKRIQDMMQQLENVIQTAAKDPALTIGQYSLVTESSQICLPDPTAGLNWNQFEGAITDIFASNAKLFPERSCVIESIDSSKHRAFTYHQIHQASNVVAHCLLNNGIEREDVVVLYSYRGVDLVVAIMGVLKAGATFCVIDPAYPPPRQNVYLSVAKPKGLIILRKAGQLHQEVRNYIQQNLEIKIEVPALEIFDDGSLDGGMNASGQSILASVLGLASVHPNISLGPDSIGTLSFTSGSTGIPKGVRGRHFSLTHFYPWMKKEFGMSEKDRFTMLSGIAHDPIQRDIFTPLFLGAELRIPTADDIGTPGRLAEWMFENGVSVTHLTPAMGQLLSANATQQIPSLTNAFFVGDVLTKRDVMRLQSLAPNTNVINMYGTTETQRAVSYLKIPPVQSNPGFLSEQKDIMPAGKGMIDVQLLVLNKHGALCGVGELGEIYVRSSGLAEGYLALPDATAEKFVMNPFRKENLITDTSLPYYQGPRDRMYRSGDLGRYRPDGSVECTGRADDQVKIRGFRIELKEIDTHLSQCPEVRENVTLVRRDKDEEKVLVSYFVPLNIPDDMAELVNQIREYLKQKLPMYAIPSVFVPLTKMPLTPNGKIDKNALPFPDTALLASTMSVLDDKDLTNTQKQVRAIWAKLLNIPATSISLEDNFFDKGGHSILATRLIFEIRKSFANDLPLSLVYQEPTIKRMAHRVDMNREGGLNLAGQAVDANAQPKPKRMTSAESMKVRLKDETEEEQEFDYASEVEVLFKEHLEKLPLTTFSFPHMHRKPDLNVFITGVTGFLGAFIVSSVLKRYSNAKVWCHLRAKSIEEGFGRLEKNLSAHLLWKEEWRSRIEIVCGDLAQPNLGIESNLWTQLTEKIDAIIHNGALVHWVYPYVKLKAANVLGTVECLKLSATHHMKTMYFVSSTSVLDTDHYANMLSLGEKGKISEQDNLDGSSKGLRSGYGQSKWVSERLIMKAREHGFKSCIIRPGYIVGDSQSGVGNTDDFLWRMVKGCIQLKSVPRIANIVNMCPVDYVASSIVAVMGHETHLSKDVYHIWHPHHFRFDDMFAALQKVGYDVETLEYVHWRTALMELTLTLNDHALYPLLHFVLDDLPTSTKSPELDEQNTRDACQTEEDIYGNNGLLLKCPNVGQLMPLYLGYLVSTGFLEKPQKIAESQLYVALEHRDEWMNLKGLSSGRSGK